ncbi:MAG: tetratricopeptide repeat protein [Nitrospirae bacterium]|nr:tetratricopeptide repeat protein [Nitrospirota bacterium]
MSTKFININPILTTNFLKHQDLFFCILAVFIVFFVYANSLNNGFVWDDTNVIVTNPALRGPAFDVFNRIDNTRDYEMLPYYRPLTIFTFMVEERMYGLNPAFMHLVNILLHSINALLVYILARSFISQNYVAFLASLLFAVHPVNTETVNFIAVRNNLLSCLCVLSAYLLCRKSIIADRLHIAFAGASFFMAGLFSKETTIMVFPFIIALEFAALRANAFRAFVRPIVRLIPYVFALIFYLGMRWLTLSNLGIQTSIIPGFGAEKLQGFYKIPDLWSRLFDNIYIIPRYLMTVVWPTALSPRYSIPESFSDLFLELCAAWICIIAMLFWLMTRGRSKTTIFGLSWLIAFWMPVSGLVMFPSAQMADRYMYIPAIGVWLIVSDQIGRLYFSVKDSHKYFISVVVILLLLLAGLTVKRNMDWKSDITLFGRFVEQYPNDAYSHLGLGDAYFGERNIDSRYLDLAEPEYKKALALKPVLPGAHTNLGYIRLAKGDYEGAVHYYTIALGGYPLDKEALLNRGIALENLGRQKEAVEDFKRFLSVPGYELSEARPYAEARIIELTK